MTEDQQIEEMESSLHLQYPVPHVMPIDDYLLSCLNFDIFNPSEESECE